jgi:hypothetical protein
MERKFVTLQQMFSDAQEIEDNLQAYVKLSDRIEYEELKDEERATMYDNKEVDCVISLLEGSQQFVLVENNDQFSNPQAIVPKCFAADLNFNDFHHKQRNDYTMNFFEIFSEECHESAEPPIEEQGDFPIFLDDDIVDVVDFPRYDEYNDDYDVDFLEQLVACSQSTQRMFSLNKLVKAISLCIIFMLLNMMKIVNRLKEILYPCAFLHSN